MRGVRKSTIRAARALCVSGTAMPGAPSPQVGTQANAMRPPKRARQSKGAAKSGAAAAAGAAAAEPMALSDADAAALYQEFAGACRSLPGAQMPPGARVAQLVAPLAGGGRRVRRGSAARDAAAALRRVRRSDQGCCAGCAAAGGCGPGFSRALAAHPDAARRPAGALRASH